MQCRVLERLKARHPSYLSTNLTRYGDHVWMPGIFDIFRDIFFYTNHRYNGLCELSFLVKFTIFILN